LLLLGLRYLRPRTLFFRGHTHCAIDGRDAELILSKKVSGLLHQKWVYGNPSFLPWILISGAEMFMPENTIFFSMPNSW
jgi:hypothetical protein